MSRVHETTQKRPGKPASGPPSPFALQAQRAWPEKRTRAQAAPSSPALEAGSDGQVQRAPEIAATDTEMGKRVAEQVNAINGANTATTGIHYAHNYKAKAARYTQNPGANLADKPYADFWQEDYWQGYADPNYFTRTAHMSWQLKAMTSAAEAIKAWMAGPTIAECASALIAIETNTLRAAIGDDKFDALYSEFPNAPPQKGLLTITQFPNTSSVGQYMGKTNEAILSLYGNDTPNSRSVEKGEWYYFYNHPKYLLKHPGGAFQGENAVCMNATKGSQTWAGFGVAPVSETEMMNEMARAYNAARTERDYQVLLTKYASGVAAQKTADNTYQALYLGLADKSVIPDEYREDKGVFPTDDIDATAILNAAEYTLDGVKRKGGFVSGAGKRLSSVKVSATRNG